MFLKICFVKKFLNIKTISVVKPIIFVCVFIFFSCINEQKDYNIMFIGDSLIARWDVESSFPSVLSENLGRSGSGIAYIEELNDKFNGCDIVVLFGTNDLGMAKRIGIEAYAERYVNAIINLKGRNIYLYSILPRSFKGDQIGLNDLIDSLNQNIKKRIIIYKNVKYINVNSQFRTQHGMNEELSYDGLHLNNYGYEILSRELKKYIE